MLFGAGRPVGFAVSVVGLGVMMMEYLAEVSSCCLLNC